MTTQERIHLFQGDVVFNKAKKAMLQLLLACETNPTMDVVDVDMFLVEALSWLINKLLLPE